MKQAIIHWLKLNYLLLLVVLGWLVSAAAAMHALITVYGWWTLLFIAVCALSTYVFNSRE